MYNQRLGICRGCGKQIIWTQTVKGKSMPCDPEIIDFEPGGGPETFVTPDGKVMRGKRAKSGGMVGYISHFATCPQRDQFRKEKQNG